MEVNKKTNKNLLVPVFIFSGLIWGMYFLCIR